MITIDNDHYQYNSSSGVSDFAFEVGDIKRILESPKGADENFSEIALEKDVFDDIWMRLAESIKQHVALLENQLRKLGFDPG